MGIDHLKRKLARDLYLEDLTPKQIATRMGITRQRVHQLLQDTDVPSLMAADKAKARAEKVAAQLERARKRKAFKASMASEPCRTCARPLRAAIGYGGGECAACRCYRRKNGTNRPAEFWGPPRKRNKERLPCACGRGPCVAREKCQKCYYAWRKEQASLARLGNEETPG